MSFDPSSTGQSQSSQAGAHQAAHELHERIIAHASMMQAQYGHHGLMAATIAVQIAAATLQQRITKGEA